MKGCHSRKKILLTSKISEGQPNRITRWEFCRAIPLVAGGTLSALHLLEGASHKDFVLSPDRRQGQQRE